MTTCPDSDEVLPADADRDAHPRIDRPPDLAKSAFLAGGCSLEHR